MKNKKKTCITIVVCLVVGIISGIAYFQVGKAAKKDNSQVVNESTTTKKDKGVVSLKRLLNQSNLKSWSSKMIKKSLEAYFFTLKNKIVFCKKQFQNMSVFCFVSTEIV